MGSRNSILVVDDEKEIRILLARFLVRKGFTVWSASTLEEGIQIFRQDSPDIVLLDINLPDGNGLKEIKSFSQVKGQKIIVMSALDTIEVRNEAMKNGAYDFLSKPFNISKLNELVQNQIN